ncbi:MAG: RagB/SusD family nutrient uptake outer membrane protein [Tannerellaceae bacterium]|jgi:hypothetical protein|nr:RagB/SusD family nutrient uptake outer membrane protein [Tannerellaceae bacterium]
MKKYSILSMLIGLLFVAGCSDFLEITPVGAVDDAALVANDKGIDMALSGAYSLLYALNFGNFSCELSNYQYGDVMGGQANKGSAAADQSPFSQLEQYVITTDNSYLATKWNSVYNGVFRANTLMNLAESIKEELQATPGESGGDLYTEVMGHGYFLRAFWHFEGIKIYGAAIPYVGTEEYNSGVNPQVSNVDEGGNYIYIWDQVVADARRAYESLPEVLPVNTGYANKWAAASLLAKIYVYWSSPYNGKNGNADHWSDAKTILETIINGGKDAKGQKYRLADEYATLYQAGESDWTGESIFDIQHAISGTQTSTNTINGGPHIGMVGKLGVGGWGFYQPSYEMVNSYIVNEAGLPLLDGTYRSRDPLSHLVDNSTVITTDLSVYTDPRIDISLGRYDTPYLDYEVPHTIDGWIRELANGGPYLNKKNIPSKADRGSLSVETSAASSAKNFHLIRYADVLLWYAEALIETGNPQGAAQYVNQVRARAANSYVKAVAGWDDGYQSCDMSPASSDYVLEDLVNGTTKADAAANYRIGLYPESQFATKDGALKALRFERHIEMALEGHRWFDLVRWGIAGDELNDYIDYEKQYLAKYAPAVYNDKWVTLPIPNNQIITMEGLLVQNENWK